MFKSREEAVGARKKRQEIFSAVCGQNVENQESFPHPRKTHSKSLWKVETLVENSAAAESKLFHPQAGPTAGFRLKKALPRS